MKTRTARIMLVILSVFASFVICLCVSLSDIAPVIIVVMLAAAAALAREGHGRRPFTVIKLSTQKRE
jgi:hypothetical protein